MSKLILSALVLLLAGSAQAQNCPAQLEGIRVDLGYGSWGSRGVAEQIDLLRRQSSNLSDINSYLRRMADAAPWREFDLNREINEATDRQTLPGLQNAGNDLVNLGRALEGGDIGEAKRLLAQAQGNLRRGYDGAVSVKSVVDNMQRRVNSRVETFRNDFGQTARRADGLSQALERSTRQTDYLVERVQRNLDDYVRYCAK